MTPADWSGATHIECDRRNAHRLRAAITEEYDVVIDVSGYTASDVSTMLDALRKEPDKYIFISSAAVYDGTRARLPFREGEGLGGGAAWGEYGVQKFRAEEVLRTELNDRAYVLRPPYVYGPGNDLDQESFLWARLLEARPVLVPGAGETLIQFCHIDSISQFVCDIVIRSSIAPGPYNIGEDRYCSFTEYIELLADVAGTTRPDLRYITGADAPAAREYFPFRDTHLLLDTGKWHATPEHHQVNLRDGLDRTFEWCRVSGTLEFRPVPLERSLS